jgi:hypothetical protein
MYFFFEGIITTVAALSKDSEESLSSVAGKPHVPRPEVLTVLSQLIFVTWDHNLIKGVQETLAKPKSTF